MDIKVLGPRVMVELDIPRDIVSERAKAAGLVVVVDTKNIPRATTGKIIALGTDPILEEWKLTIGTRVSFGVNGGTKQFLEGKEYRMLETQEIIAILGDETKG